jgi:hypothetical protein
LPTASVARTKRLVVAFAASVLVTIELLPALPAIELEIDAVHAEFVNN